MGELYFEKFANFDRAGEPASVCMPFGAGWVFDGDLARFGVDEAICQARPLSFWHDGSIKWLKVDFLADLPANGDCRYAYGFDNRGIAADSISVFDNDGELIVDNGAIRVVLGNAAGDKPFKSLARGDYCADKISAPYVTLDGQICPAILAAPWEISESGSVLVKLTARGNHGDTDLGFVITITIYRNTPWVEIGYRIINRVKKPTITLGKIAMDIEFAPKNSPVISLATSNYLSNIATQTGGELRKTIDAEHLLYEANEHVPETFYGTFFANHSTPAGGICATHYQAYQNFPKALGVNDKSLSIEFLPEGHPIEYFRGMAKNHIFFLHLHDNENIADINKRSLCLQSRDIPRLSAEVYRDAMVYHGIFPKKFHAPFENSIMAIIDDHARAYGWLHWGDAPDIRYSAQGRGGGDLVWLNNEYDFPYGAFQLFARTGERRFFDYGAAAARHWADIDIAHDCDDPMRLGAMIEHSADHVRGPVLISHEWVEGLLAHYNHTGDDFALAAAIGIGENIRRRLDLPEYSAKGSFNARETGWALRSLVALYRQTNDPAWLEKADSIVAQFEEWMADFGGWFAPYTDHTTIRVPFMISVAVGSLMRYLWVDPPAEIREKISNMIIRAVDDMVKNCILPGGYFYYKEIPSLRRPWSNALVLEALACAYELTENADYLRHGLPTFDLHVNNRSARPPGKSIIKNGVLIEGHSPKNFAQSFFPLTYFYTCLSESEVVNEL